MASTKEFKNFILEQLSKLGSVSCRPMMGEYILYYKGVIFGGIYDDRLLIKKTKSNSTYNLSEQLPYKKGKPMYYITDIDDKEFLTEIIKATFEDLK